MTVAGAAALVAAIAGCSSSGGGGGTGKDTVAFLMPDMASTRYVTYDIPSFKAEMKQLCSDCKIIAEDANGDANLQRDQATAAISSGAKAIVVDPVDAGAAAAWINQALSRGIKVISYDRPITSVKVNYYVSFDNERIGQMIAKAELDRLKATGALNAPGSGILIVNGSPTDAAAGLIKKGVHDVVDTSGVKVLAEYDTPDWVPAKAQSWVSSQITAYGGKIKGIIAANDGTGTASAAALEAANVSPFPPVTGNDATLAGTQLLLTGKMWVTISKPGKIEADAAAHAVVSLMHGKSVPAQPGGTVETVFGTPSQLFVPTLITPQNVESQLIKPGFLKASQVCTPTYASFCAKYGVK
jgi:ABC-type xylose transport system substrate-binding protein